MRSEKVFNCHFPEKLKFGVNCKYHDRDRFLLKIMVMASLAIAVPTIFFSSEIIT